MKFIKSMAEPELQQVVNKGILARVTDSFPFNWTGSSLNMLRTIEKKILSYLKSPHRGFYVDIGPVVGDNDKIWTIGINNESSNTPLVMLHGLGAGVALWVLNYDSLSSKRSVYAIDLLGFGRSSRPSYSNDALICEKQFVKSIEEWRREMSIDKMILLGHSMGGYLATSYSISYPDKVKHLILADPWGFPEKPAETPQNLKNIPLWVKAIAFVVQPLNPLWALRAAGPWGQWVVEKTRPDITRKFSTLIEEHDLIPQYIHQCNAQTPSGESAFHVMMESYGWAKNPMIKRIETLREDVPITLIYGSRSWIDSSAGEKIKVLRPNSIVNLKVINGAGHHVYADKPSVFNQYVLEACNDADSQTNDEEKNRSTISNSSIDSQKNTPEGTESDQENERTNILKKEPSAAQSTTPTPESQLNN